MLLCFTVMRCVVSDCYASARYLVLCLIVTLVRAVLYCVQLLCLGALSCVVIDCSARARCLAW